MVHRVRQTLTLRGTGKSFEGGTLKEGERDRGGEAVGRGPVFRPPQREVTWMDSSTARASLATGFSPGRSIHADRCTTGGQELDRPGATGLKGNMLLGWLWVTQTNRVRV